MAKTQKQPGVAWHISSNNQAQPISLKRQMLRLVRHRISSKIMLLLAADLKSERKVYIWVRKGSELHVCSKRPHPFSANVEGGEGQARTSGPSFKPPYLSNPIHFESQNASCEICHDGKEKKWEATRLGIEKADYPIRPWEYEYQRSSLRPATVRVAPHQGSSSPKFPSSQLSWTVAWTGYLGFF